MTEEVVYVELSSKIPEGHDLTAGKIRHALFQSRASDPIRVLIEQEDGRVTEARITGIKRYKRGLVLRVKEA